VELKLLSPGQALGPGLTRQDVPADSISRFTACLREFLAAVASAQNHGEHEEHYKNHLRDFLRDALYKKDNCINTSDRIDLAIYKGPDAKSQPAVLFEVKRPGTPDMISPRQPNQKALHEVVLYYFRERCDNKNDAITFLVVTDTRAWYIFNAQDFERIFYRNASLLRAYQEWSHDRKVSSNTGHFYALVADFIKQSDAVLACIHFALVDDDDLLAPARNEHDLLPIWKVLSPQHLLKLDVGNDSNTLNRAFYSELLHILGLEETKDAGKKLIRRKRKPDPGSLLENTITRIESEAKFDNIPNPEHYGVTRDDQLFGIALELCITWVTRLIFLKLLEAHITTYFSGDERRRFVNHSVLADYDRLNTLFFDVLAKRPAERSQAVLRDHAFKALPYLNSTLFEPSPLERQIICISSLANDARMPIFPGTVLCDDKGVSRKGTDMPALDYLLAFLNAYNYGAESSGGIRAATRTLINAPVLGLIFEKINGYKEGAVFTPGFITMYLCRATLRRAVIAKFNKACGWDLALSEDLTELHNKIHSCLSVAKANDIMSGLRIADIAVGSGHFHVSALNELIAIKSELGILCDRRGKVLHGCTIRVDNDDLSVMDDETGKPFVYAINPATGVAPPRAQALQEALFHEKEFIIENCLFGVDINPNSVKICRLRLWIELLKHAYYTQQSGGKELHILPNIDINIKCGNSLYSLYPLGIEFDHTRDSKHSIAKYLAAVRGYKTAEDKAAKRECEKTIEAIKDEHKRRYNKESALVQTLNKARTQLEILERKANKDIPGSEPTEKELKQIAKKIGPLRERVAQLEVEVSEQEQRARQRNAFEWRIEFPEVLDEHGVFVGFDVVLGNPPYIRADVDAAHSEMRRVILDMCTGDKRTYETLWEKWDWFVPFIERGFKMLAPGGFVSYIVSDAFCHAKYAQKAQEYYLRNAKIIRLDFVSDIEVFEQGVRNMMFIFQRADGMDNQPERIVRQGKFDNITLLPTDVQSNLTYRAFFPGEQETTAQFAAETVPLEQICYITVGMVVHADEKRAQGAFKMEDLVSDNEDALHPKPFVEGKHLARWLPATHKWLEWGTARAPGMFRRQTFPEIWDVPEKCIALRICGVKKPMCVSYDASGLLHNHTAIAFVLWHSLENVRNRSLLKSASYEDQIRAETCLEREKVESASRKFQLKYILSVMNSSVALDFIRLVRRSNLDVYPDDWKKLPIPVATAEQQQPIIALVDRILAAKKADANADITALESEVDARVSALYGAA